MGRRPKSMTPTNQVMRPELEQAYRKFFTKFKKITKVVGVITFLLSCVLIGFIIDEYIDTHNFKWQAPIIVQIQTPLVVERNHLLLVSPQATSSATPSASPTPSPTPRLEVKGFSLVKKAYAAESDLEIIYKYPQAEILEKVYQKESSSGRNDGYCKSRGGVNGFGFAMPDSAIANGTAKCYATFEEVVSDVSEWFVTRFHEGYSEAEAYCYYNTGIRQSNCRYYQEILAL